LKILSLTGTRPELIRLSVIIEKLDELLKEDHIFVYTNQNYDPNLSDIIFKDLNIRKPNYIIKESYDNFASFFSNAILMFDMILMKEAPDKILTLGDTNSGLLSILARKRNIPIYHMEAGNRCFDERVPEESNRRIIDAISTINMPYTTNAYENLMREGYHRNSVFKTGNPINEVINKKKNKFKIPDIKDFDHKNEKYILVTLHRSENVDNSDSLNSIINTLNIISNEYRVIISLHPRTRSKIDPEDFSKNIDLCKPFNFSEFLNLLNYSSLVITDSGTVQEEACIFRKKCLVIRNSTERPETIESGASILVGTNTDSIITGFKRAKFPTLMGIHSIPEDYLVKNVSDIVLNILLGK